MTLVPTSNLSEDAAGYDADQLFSTVADSTVQKTELLLVIKRTKHDFEL